MAPPQVCASVLSVVVLSAAQGVRKQVTSPRMSDMTLRALGASSVLVTALCSEISSAGMPSRRFQKAGGGYGVAGAQNACSHSSCHRTLGSVSVPVGQGLFLTVSTCWSVPCVWSSALGLVHLTSREI